MVSASPPPVAVVGAGYWGINHVRNFYQLGALACVCDTNLSSLARIAETYPGVRTVEDFRGVLMDPSIKGVVIATPAETHFSLASAALRAGKDVLVEKPITLNAADGRRLLRLAANHDAVLMVGHLLEYHPAVSRLGELIGSGELGEIQYIYANRLNLGKVRREENILWSFAPHDIAVILRLVGSMPVRVTATGGAYLQPAIADVTVSTLEFASGLRGHIFVSWLHPYKDHRLVVVGSERMAVFDDLQTGNKLVVYDQRVEWVNGDPVPRRCSGIPQRIADDEPLRNECAHFLDCIENRTSPLTDGQSALRVLRVLEAAELSLAGSGRPVELDAARPTATRAASH